MAAPRITDRTFPLALDELRLRPVRRAIHNVLFAGLMLSTAACSSGSQPSPSTDTTETETAGPIFESETWPEEGRPVIEVVAPALAVHAAPRFDAPVVSTLQVPANSTLEYDSTRFQTLRPAAVTAIRDAEVTGRDFGSIEYLSQDAYYRGSHAKASVPVKSGVQFEYLQYRAEGTCFVRIEGRVIDAARCPTYDSANFRVAGEPETAWWVRATSDSKPVGWVLVSDTTAVDARRTF